MNASKNSGIVGKSAVVALSVCVLAGAGAFRPVLAAASAASDAALARFVAAGSVADASKAADDVAKSGATFDEVYAALKKGRTYSGTVPKGVVRDSHKLGDLTFNYQLDVPETYDPAKRWQLRVQLHGGVGRP